MKRTNFTAFDAEDLLDIKNALRRHGERLIAFSDLIEAPAAVDNSPPPPATPPAATLAPGSPLFAGPSAASPPAARPTADLQVAPLTGPPAPTILPPVPHEDPSTDSIDRLVSVINSSLTDLPTTSSNGMPSFGTLSDSDLELLAHIPSDLPNVLLPDLLATMSNILSSLGHGIDESTTESIIEPTVESAVEPAVEPASEPVAKSFGEPATESASESAVEEPAVGSAVEEPAVGSAVEANGTGDETTDGSGLETNESSHDENWSLFNGEPGAPRQSVQARLGLEGGANRAVLAPVLFSTLVALCSAPVEDVSGPLLEGAFREATGLDLESVRVVFRHGIQTMASSDLAIKFKRWATNLHMLVQNSTSIDYVLDLTTVCNSAYDRECGNDASGSTSGINEQAAQRVLSDRNLKGSLFLGLKPADISALCRQLGCVVGKGPGTEAA
ncbi:hypothetical protein IWW39_002458 [Coemansia spiralis]|uniref:Uncharacterized protein n=1 Tax=Coemansia spiralis TaxID=417178 RepID=A0A9W8L3J2_9FUNG|nr:hypothetical protein IWW39_002458 [Coemansia spiralis]